MLPIFVPDEKTKFSIWVTALATPMPAALRLDMEIDPADATSASPDSKKVVAQLRRLHGVSDVAVSRSDSQDRVPVRYELVLRPANAQAVRSAFDHLRQMYAPAYHIRGFDVRGISENCQAIESQLLTSAVRAGTSRAAFIAQNAHQPLRKLVLAVAFPMHVEDDECSTHAQISAGSAYFRTDEEPESPRNVSLGLTAALIFRTFPHTANSDERIFSPTRESTGARRAPGPRCT